MDWVKNSWASAKPSGTKSSLATTLFANERTRTTNNISATAVSTTAEARLSKHDHNSFWYLSNNLIANNSPPDLSSHSSPSTIHSSPQPITPPSYLADTTMPSSTSPIDIATPTRNASSSPSSQGTKAGNFYGAEDSRTSALMTSGGLDPNSGRTRMDSYSGAKPISMNNANRNGDTRPRRESLAGSLVGGMSWGGVSVGSWIRDE
jgi:hypothetical protein